MWWLNLHGLNLSEYTNMANVRYIEEFLTLQRRSVHFYLKSQYRAVNTFHFSYKNHFVLYRTKVTPGSENTEHIKTFWTKFTIFKCSRNCLSIRMEQLVSHWTDFHEILYLSIFRKSIERTQVLLKSDKHDRQFTLRPIHIFTTPRSVIVGMRNVSEKIWRENQNAHFIFNFFFEDRDAYEIKWKNILDTGRLQMTI
jgi:hypothetical protein